MNGEKIFTQADVDAAVMKALAAAIGGKTDPQPAPASAPAKVFYHLYICPSLACLKATNPQPGSWHQRGVHLAQSTPRTDVKCPGCGGFMVIGRDGCDAKGNALPDGQMTSDRDGNAVLHGRVIIQDAPNMPDQTAEIAAENVT